MLGVDKGKLQMIEYDPNWPILGQEIVERVKKAMKGYAVACRHVGSTAIPGMFAKPIIDIAVAVKNIEDVDRCVKDMEENGFDYAGEVISGQREFSIDNELGQRICHVHVVEEKSLQWENYNLVVDYCIANKEEREAYINLKKELLEKYKDEPEKYGPAKSEFMEELIKRASEWKKNKK